MEIKRILPVFGLLFCLFSFPGFLDPLFAQSLPQKVWEKTFGGTSNDDFRALATTSDGGYIIGGNSYSGLNGDKSQPSKGDSDYWIIKIDSLGNKLWDKSYGGIGREILWSLQQTADNGFILAGTSDSGMSFDKTDPEKGVFWIVKVDANGNKLWDKSLVGGYNYPAIIQTNDGGYFLGGMSSSGITRDKSQPSKGSSDYWAVRLDANGNKIWDKTLGGSDMEELHSVKQTSDGGFILGGSSQSGIGGDKSQPSIRFHDFWIVKLDAFGNKIWDVTLGGNMPDILYTIMQTSDGGYIAGGQTQSTRSGDVSDVARGKTDFWVVKIDASGQKLWDKTFGGPEVETMFSVEQCMDGGFVLGGYSASGISDDKSQASQGDLDYWIIKVDSLGNKQWDFAIGGNHGDVLIASGLTKDGGLILGGISTSPVSGDKTEPGRGIIDYWVVKLKGGLGENPAEPITAPAIVPPNSVSLSQNRPNPFNKNTRIYFDLPAAGQVELLIYNNQGQVLARHQKHYDAGSHEVKWDMLMKGKKANSGIYYYKLSTSSFQDVKSMILLEN